MKLYRSKQDIFLHDTQVENLFISEYMIPADGTAVKVYLLGKMYLDSGQSLSLDDFSKYLRLSRDTIVAAWRYWEKKGVVKIHSSSSPGDFDLEFVCLRQLMLGRASDASSEIREEEPSQDTDAAIAELNSGLYSPSQLELFSRVEQKTGRTLNSSEIKDLTLWSENMGIAPDVIVKAYDICINERKADPSRAYISRIINEWSRRGLTTGEKLEEYLEEHDRRHNTYKRIFKALGFIGRSPSEEEKRIMDTWFDEYMLDISTILEACKKSSGISNPSINYINAIVTNWQKEGKVTASGKPAPTLSQIKKHYEAIRSENKAMAEERKKEVYAKLPRIRQIEAELLELNPQRLQLILKGQKKSSTYKAMEEEMKNLRLEKSHLLEKAGYPSDYLNPIYTCPVCKDTGFLENGEKCVCLTRRLMEE